MARKLQHIADLDDAERAVHAGEKVGMLCGVKRYPMRGMADSIPTCTVCARMAFKEMSQGISYWGGE